MEFIKKLYFKKPTGICIDLPDEIKMAIQQNRFRFLSWFRKYIDERVDGFGLCLRGGTLGDIPSVMKFVDSNYTKLEGNSLTAYDYYRFTEYGNTLILENENEIIGSIFEIGYDTAERTSYAMRFVVSKNVRGRGIAQLLTDCTTMKAIERGSRVIRATIAVKNYVSLFFHLNKVGMIIESLNPEIEGLTRYYQASLPATPKGVFENRIERSKVLPYLKQLKEGEEYRMIDTEDELAIEKALVEDNFKFVALMPARNKRYNFLALPYESVFSDE